MLSHIKNKLDIELSSTAFDQNLRDSIGRPTLALEMLRQMCLCSRTETDGKPILKENLLILIEAADMLVPESEITRLADADRHRINICQDWFADPGFMNGGAPV